MNPRPILARSLVLACLIPPALGVLPHPAAAQSRNPESYVLLLETAASITRGSTVNGNVGINETGGSLSLTRNATISGNSQAVADKFKLGPLSRVFDVFTNVLRQNPNGSVLAGTLT